MSQPITLTLAQRAAASSLAGILVLGLLSMPFLALLPASHPLAARVADAERQNPLLRHCGGGADPSGAMRAMPSLGHGSRPGGYARMYPDARAAGDGLPAMSFSPERAALVPGHAAFRLAMALVVLVPGLLGPGFRPFARSKIKGLFLDHDPGPDLCRYAAVLSQRDRVWRQQRLHRFYPRCWASVTATGTRASLFMATVLLLLLTLWLGAALAQCLAGSTGT